MQPVPVLSDLVVMSDSDGSQGGELSENEQEQKERRRRAAKARNVRRKKKTGSATDAQGGTLNVLTSAGGVEGVVARRREKQDKAEKNLDLPYYVVEMLQVRVWLQGYALCCVDGDKTETERQNKEEIRERGTYTERDRDRETDSERDTCVDSDGNRDRGMETERWSETETER